MRKCRRMMAFARTIIPGRILATQHVLFIGPSFAPCGKPAESTGANCGGQERKEGEAVGYGGVRLHSGVSAFFLSCWRALSSGNYDPCTICHKASSQERE